MPANHEWYGSGPRTRKQGKHNQAVLQKAHKYYLGITIGMESGPRTPAARLWYPILPFAADRVLRAHLFSESVLFSGSVLSFPRAGRTFFFWAGLFFSWVGSFLFLGRFLSSGSVFFSGPVFFFLGRSFIFLDGLSFLCRTPNI